MSEMELNIKDFKALASETRHKILRALDGKRLSLNDIARNTNLHKMTLHEHLVKLVETGYVKRYEREGHKWVYYKLSRKGVSLLHPRKSKVIIIFSITIIVCMSIVGANILLNILIPLDIQSMESEFEGIKIEVTTDKEVYSVGEDVVVSVTLTNTNANDTVLHCRGYEKENTHELFSYFHIIAYTENYGKIWYHTKPGPENHEYWYTSYEIVINGSSSITFNDVCAWNQTAKNIYSYYENKSYEHNKQVPPGTYIITAMVPLDMTHYFGTEFQQFEFGASKTITIE